MYDENRKKEDRKQDELLVQNELNYIYLSIYL